MTEATFPDGFLWGAATAGRQVEGSNVNSNYWEWEHAPDTPFAEPSGDAVDHYHRWREDLDLLAGAGHTAYRFGLEWSRIEPEEGEVSRACLDHYRRMLVVTENGLATTDDRERIAFTGDALRGLHAAVRDGVDVRGYVHWSLLDNFEWFGGYAATFGLIAVDRSTFGRTPKPSLGWLGDIARRNGLA